MFAKLSALPRVPAGPFPQEKLMTWLQMLTIVPVAAGAAAGKRGLRRRRGAPPPWLLDGAIAAAAAAYAAIGAVPLVFHLPFLYHSFPFGERAALLVAAGGLAMLLLNFLL